MKKDECTSVIKPPFEWAEQKNDALVGRLIWKTLIPQFATELSLSMTSIIDGIIVGRFYGENGLAAVGIGAPILSVFTITAGILSTGNSVLCASLIGKSSHGKAGKVFSLAILWSLILSVLLTVVCVGCAEPIARAFGGNQKPELLPAVADYIRGFSLGAGMIIFRQLLAPMVNMAGGTRFMYLSSLSILGMDLVADVVSSAFLNGGTFGLGAASALSYVCGCFVLVFFYLIKRRGLKVSLRGCFSLRGSLDIFREGIPTALKRLCDLVAPVLTNRFVLVIGSVSTMAAMSVMNSATRFPLCLVLSLSTTVLMLTGTFYAESDREEMEAACKKLFLHTVLWSTAASAIFFVFARPIAAFFVHGDPSVVETAAYGIRWYVVGIPFLALNQCAAFYLQALGHLKISNAIMIVDRLVTTVVLLYLLGWLMGEKGVFIAYGVSEIVLTVALYIIASVRIGRPVTRIRQVLFLPEDYGVPDEDCLFALFHTKEDAMGISEAVHDFCIKKGIDERRSFLAALCTEELAMNVVSYGFTSDRQQLSVRLFIRFISEHAEDAQITIRFRDNGKPFDIIKRRQLVEESETDPMKNVGIRLVFATAKSVSYNAAYGMNNTVITL